jgi:3'-5' exoribonuclease
MKDLVLSGVILHDLGKIRELAWSSGFEYTLEGTLLGHIQIGAAMIEKTIDTLPNFPPRLKTLVLHMILSHHGKLEFGSPKLPMIPEALMLSFLDDMDAKMQTLATEFARAARQGKGPTDMTDKIWALDQRTMLNSRAWLAEANTSNAATAEVISTKLEPAAPHKAETGDGGCIDAEMPSIVAAGLFKDLN